MIEKAHFSTPNTKEREREKNHQTNDSLGDFSRLMRVHFLAFQFIFQVFCVIKSNYGSDSEFRFEYFSGHFNALWTSVSSVDNVYTQNEKSRCHCARTRALCLSIRGLYWRLLFFPLAITIIIMLTFPHTIRTRVFVCRLLYFRLIHWMGKPEEQMCCKNLVFQLRQAMKLNERQWKWWLKKQPNLQTTAKEKWDDAKKIDSRKNSAKTREQHQSHPGPLQFVCITRHFVGISFTE